MNGVGIGTGAHWLTLDVSSSSRGTDGTKLETLASGTVSPAFIAELTRDGGQRLAVTTVDSRDVKTDTGIGPSGLTAGKSFVSACSELGLQAEAAPQAAHAPR